MKRRSKSYDEDPFDKSLGNGTVHLSPTSNKLAHQVTTIEDSSYLDSLVKKSKSSEDAVLK